MRLFETQQVEQRSYPSGAIHNFYIYGPVSPDINEYVNMITILDLAEANDVINIFLNTPGGALDTTISIIHAMMRSKATIVCHADGMVASAGTLIFFAARNYTIYPYANFMFHDGAMGTQGKINESMKNVSATSKLIERLARDMYGAVFTESEITDILEGRDYYCDAQEMLDRIEAGNTKLEEDNEPEDEHDISIYDRILVVGPTLATYGLTGTVIDIKNSKYVVELEDGSVARYSVDGKSIVKRDNI